MTELLAMANDLTLNQLLEKGIATFFAVVLLYIVVREGRTQRREQKANSDEVTAALNSQTSMMRECFLWLGSLIRADKGIPPPSKPGLPGDTAFHEHRRSDDPAPGTPGHPGNGSYPTLKPHKKKGEEDA